MSADRGVALVLAVMTAYDDGMRTIVDLTDEQLAALDGWRRAHGVSRAEAIRRAVERLLGDERERQAAADAAFGLWRDRAEDGLLVQERLRGEWGER